MTEQYYFVRHLNKRMKQNSQKIRSFLQSIRFGFTYTPLEFRIQCHFIKMYAKQNWQDAVVLMEKYGQ